MSHPKIAAPGEAYCTVWYIEQFAHAALSMNVSMSVGCTESALSNSDVRIMVLRPDGRAHKWRSLVDS